MRNLEREHYSFVGRYERLSPKVVSEVVINQDLARSEDSKLKKWLDKDYLLEHALLMGLGLPSVDGGTRRVQMPTMHRGIVLSMVAPFFDEYGTAYGQIAGKGNGLTEYGFERRSGRLSVQTNHMDAFYIPYETTKHEPQGLYGANDAGFEMDVTNDFAAASGRTSRVIGNIILNPEALVEEIKKIGYHDKYTIEKQIEIVEENKDTPAFMVRLLGTDRIPDITTKRSEFKQATIAEPVDKAEEPDAKKEEGIFTARHGFDRAYRLIASEMRSNPDFLSRYKLEDYIQQLSPLLNAVIQGSRVPVNPALVSSFFWLNSYLFGWNEGVLENLSRDKYSSRLASPDVDVQQNFDLAGFWNDWENARDYPHESKYVLKKLGSYTSLAWNQVQTFVLGEPIPQEIIRAEKRISDAGRHGYLKGLSYSNSEFSF